MDYDDNGLVERFEAFFREYYSDEVGDLARNYPRDQKSLCVDWRDLYKFDAELAEDYGYHPDRYQAAAEEALRRYDLPIDVSLGQAHVRVHGLTQTNAVSDIHSEHLNRLVSITGVVDRAEAPRSHIEQAVFVCQRCSYQTQVPQGQGNELREPYQCESCERQGPFKLDPNKSEFVDHQQVRLRERPTGGAATADHESIIAVLEDDLVKEVAPGDHIILTGVVRYDSDQSFDATLVDKYVETTDVSPDQTFGIDPDPYQDEIDALPERETIYEDFVDSLAPSIHGYEDVKLALLLQLFSGVTKHLPDETRIRGNIHTLIVGSPSTGKTQLLKAFANVAQHALYVDAGNSTGVGLTTAAVRTAGGRNAWELEAGPLTLADNGFAALDSLDSLSAEDQQKLREPLEHQQISSSKGDNTTSLTARTSVLAAANPMYGQWDEYEPLGDQLGITPGVLSKFDLVFLTTDWDRDSDDRALADAILRTSQAGELLARKEHGDTHDVDADVLDGVTPPIDPGLLGTYAAYARRTCYPAVSEEARRELENFYVDLRERTSNVGIPLPVTAMKLEALVRLAEASARVRLSDTITTEDVNRVTSLVEQSLGVFDLESAPASPEAEESEGSPDGPLTDAEKVKRVRSIIADIDDKQSEGAPVEDVLSLAVQRNIYPGVERSRVEDQIEKLKKQGEVYEPSTDHLRTT